jgi:RIO kinase 1
MAKFKKPEHKVEHQVFDEATLVTLHKLQKGKFFDDIGGPIAIGKEANVFSAEKGDSKVAIKIYRIETSSFNRLLPYIAGDPRFSVKKEKRSLIYTWTRKEFRNLKRAHKAGVSVPKPHTSMNNVLIMDFIGDEEAAPTLKVTSLENPQQFYEEVIENMQKLYKANLVHADLSEFNILVKNKEPVFIDLGQAVLTEHPNAAIFLQRDCENIARFFGKLGVKTSPEGILNRMQASL